MIWGWSQMKVGLIQVTSRKSPTNCGVKRKVISKDSLTKRENKERPYNRWWCSPCPGGGLWFWVEDIQLLSVHRGCQRIYVSLRTKERHMLNKKWLVLQKNKPYILKGQRERIVRETLQSPQRKKKKRGGFKFYHHCCSCQSEGIWLP